MKMLQLSAITLAAALISGTALADVTPTALKTTSDTFGTITINGKVIDQTCKIKTNDEQNKTVTLPTVSKTSLSQAGAVAGLTPFTIELSNCKIAADGITKVKAYFNYNSSYVDTNNSYTLKNVAATTPASAVNVQLTNDDGTAIKVGPDVATQNVQGVALPTTNGGAVALHYNAQYYATAAAGTGNVESKVQYNIAYE